MSKMLISLPCSSSFRALPTPSHEFSCYHHNYLTTVSLLNRNYCARKPGDSFLVSRAPKRNTHVLRSQIQDDLENVDNFDYGYVNRDDGDSENNDYEFSGERRYRGRQEERDYDKDPEFAEILGNCLNNPQRAQDKMEERLRKKRNKVVQTKTGSATPLKVIFNKFDFSNSYIWFEFYNAPLETDVTLICDTIRAWHIVGRLGGCNSMNMQLSQSTFDKRPNYDAIRGANMAPTTFYNIGDFEIQENLARLWIDIGTCEPLLLDVLINALTQISSDYVGIKQLTFGGSQYENWKENLTSEDSGFSVHKI